MFLKEKMQFESNFMEPKSSFGIGDLVPILNKTVQPLLQGSDSTQTCELILKALVNYVANTPVSVAVNLFKGDQNQSIPGTLSSQEDWQQVFHSFSRFHVSEREERSEQDYYVPFPKPDTTITLINQIISYFNHHEQEDTSLHITVVLGFWVVKLYLESMHRTKFTDLPETLKEIYRKFVSLAGHEWHNQSISLSFNDPEFNKFGMNPQWFPYAVSDDILAIEEVPQFIQSDPIQVDAYILPDDNQNFAGYNKNSSTLMDMDPENNFGTVEDNYAMERTVDASTCMHMYGRPEKKRRLINYSGNEVTRYFDASTYFSGISDEHLPYKKRRHFRKEYE